MFETIAGGNALRVYIVAIYTGDFCTAGVKATKFLYVAAGCALFLGVSAVSVAMSTTIAFVMYPILRSPSAAIFVVALPVLYVVSYIAFGVLQYKRHKTVLEDRSWEDYFSSGYRSIVREVGVADASYRATSCWLIFTFMPPALWPWGRFVQARPPAPQVESNAAGSLMFTSILVFMASISVLVLLDKILPHKRIINRGLIIFRTIKHNGGSRPEKTKHRGAIRLPASARPSSFASARWRTRTHRTGYALAQSLERAVIGLRRRFVKDEYEQLYRTYMKVANALRRYSITADSKYSRTYLNLVQCSIALVALDQPLSTIQKAQELTKDEPEQFPERGKLLTTLGFLNSHVQASWTTLKIAGALVTIAVISFLGKWAEIGKYFLQQ